MRKFGALLTSCVLSLLGVSSASAILSPVYVDAAIGSNANAGTGCLISAPCADLNTALSAITDVPLVILLRGGFFGPIVLANEVTIMGPDAGEQAIILADPAAQVGCIGHLPAACGLTNHGYAVEINSPLHGVHLSHLDLVGVDVTSAALGYLQGGSIELEYLTINSGSTTPAVQLYPNNAGGQANVWFSHSTITGGPLSNPNSGAVEVKPTGSTSIALHFNHMQVHNASYGIRTDGSAVSDPSVQISTFVSDSEFFLFSNAAVNAFSTAGTGTVKATFDSTKILNASVALKANGPQSTVFINNNTVSGNATGVLVQNGAIVLTSGNNGIRNNGTNISGTLTPAPTN